MADQGQRTEKPTKRKIDKSRREGQFPASRELLAALQFLTFVVLLITGGGAFLERAREMVRYVLVAAFHLTVTPRAVLRIYGELLGEIFTPLLWMGGCLTASGARRATREHAARTSRYTIWCPIPAALIPLQKLRNVPRQNAAAFLQAVLFLPLLALAVYKIAGANLAAYAGLARESLPAGLAHDRRLVSAIFCGKQRRCSAPSALLDFVRVYRHHYKSLRMTKLEVRDELKETEGNPQIKQRVRRIQRDLARRNMLKEIPNATAVIVNPTPFRGGHPLRHGSHVGAARLGQRQELPGAPDSPDRHGSSGADRGKSAAWPRPCTNPRMSARRFHRIFTAPWPKCWPTFTNLCIRGRSSQKKWG